jgi:hypothetical protein
MAELIRDEATWWYMGFVGTSTRRLRVWRVAPGRLVAVVTERPDDAGTSITNAAEMVAAQLAIEYPDDMVEVVEHWTASVLDDEHFTRWPLWTVSRSGNVSRPGSWSTGSARSYSTPAGREESADGPERARSLGRPGGRLTDELGDVLPTARRGRDQPVHHRPGLVLAPEVVAHLAAGGVAVAGAHVPPMAV